MDRQHIRLSRSLALALPALLSTLLAARPGVAAELAPEDRQYLLSHFGAAAAATIGEPGASEAARLHELIRDPNYKTYPEIAADNVAGYLFDLRTRRCAAWHETHSGQQCPPPADAALAPGQEVADRSCNACHLFGTMEAPSFHRLAQQGGIDANRLAAALASGHRMSPITLAAEQIESLAPYIRAMK